MPCHRSCAACTNNATDCSSCKNVTGIVYYNLNNTSCHLVCPNGYFGQIQNNTCIACHPYCSRCFGADEYSCTACQTFNGTKYHLVFGANTCINICPAGQYANSTSHLCLVCDSNCATCNGTSKNCTSCFLVNGFYVYLSNNICLQNCPHGYYNDFLTKKCNPCHEGCATCTGSTLYDCQSCDNYTNVTNYTYYKVIN